MNNKIIRVRAKDVKDILKATFPECRKTTAWIDYTGRCHFHDLNWSGGTRIEYRACLLNGQALTARRDLNTPAPWANPYEGLVVDVPENAAIVAWGYFCGKPSVPTIYVNPNNLAKLIA